MYYACRYIRMYDDVLILMHTHTYTFYTFFHQIVKHLFVTFRNLSPQDSSTIRPHCQWFIPAASQYLRP